MAEQILSNILKISDYGRKSFTDRDLIKLKSDSMNDFLEKNNYMFEIIKINFDSCPACKKLLLDTKKNFCGGCGKNFNMDEINHSRISLKKEMFFEFFIKYLNNLLENFKLLKREGNFILFENNDFAVVISLSFDELSLRDYYMLRGWLDSHSKKSIFLMISKEFDKELKIFQSKNPTINLFNFVEIFQDAELMKSKINYSLDNIKEESDFEIKSGGKFEEELNILELKDRINQTLTNLDNYALHKNNLSPQENGRRYQRAIVEILNQTILPIRVLIKQNIQDVLIRVPHTNIKRNNQIKWIPLEIKSFGIDSKNDGKFSVRNYSSQFIRYIEGHINDPLVASSINVECFVILAKDFLIDQDNLDSISTIEKKFDNNIHISLLPQDTLIYLMNKKIDQKSPIINFDLIADLFRKNQYVTKSNIDDFYKNIEDDFLKSPEETALKVIQENVHKQGK